jgi:hypothetical protein
LHDEAAGKGVQAEQRRELVDDVAGRSEGCLWSDPTADVNEPIRLYLAKTEVRSRSVVSLVSSACSSGTSMPRSPPDGLMLPMKATSRTGAIASVAGNIRPVTTISPAPARKRLLSSKRGATKPVIKVSAAVPSSEALATMPICCGEKPIAER